MVSDETAKCFCDFFEENVEKVDFFTLNSLL